MSEISKTLPDDWDEMARLYNKLTVDVGAAPIRELLTRTNALLPFAQSTGVHDNGCGPGGVIAALIADYGAAFPSQAPLSCSDFSAAMIAQVETRKATAVAAADAAAADPLAAVWTRLHADVQNAMDLVGLPDASRSHVTAGWVYFMTPDPQRCLRETRRVLTDGGVLGCSSWKRSDWMELMTAAHRCKPGSQAPTVPEEWSSTAALEAELRKADFRDVEAVEVPVTMTFESYEGVVELLLDKMPPMVQALKSFSDEERANARRVVREEVEKKVPSKPYVMHGVSLVAVGRK